MFALAKVFWTLANPGSLLVACLVLGGLGALSPWRRLRRLGKGLLGLGVLAALAIAVLPLGPWLLGPLEGRFPMPAALPARVDGIVVLGGGIDLLASAGHGTPELNEHAERMTAFVALARRFPEARLAFTGGSGLLRAQEHREADYARILFADLGLDPARIVFERESRNTHENAVLTERLLQPRPGEAWLLVTSAVHMPRAVGAFRRAGWAVTPYPVDHMTAGPETAGLGFAFAENLAVLSLGLHEWVGLLAYRLLGRTDSLFPAPGAAGAQRG